VLTPLEVLDRKILIKFFFLCDDDVLAIKMNLLVFSRSLQIKQLLTGLTFEKRICYDGSLDDEGYAE